MNLPWRKLRLTNALLERAFFTSSYASAKKKNLGPAKFSKVKPLTPAIEVWDQIKIKELSKITQRSIDDIFEALFYIDRADVYGKVSDKIPRQDLKKVLEKLGIRGRIGPPPVETKIEHVREKIPFLDAVRQPPPAEEQLRPRRPVVTVMGHVDHGKTTLLDTLRNSHIVDEEHGGITQHIGAFSVPVPQCKLGAITFLDTPGHAAFSAMRARGANVTDMVILVVAADDGVMEQTVESIKFANEARVPMIVAINKIDKPGADPERAKRGLLEHGVQCDAEGGEVQFVPISALKGQGLDELLEAIVLQGELIGLRSAFEGLVEGYVIESLTHEHRGKLCTLLVYRGTLSKGDIIVAGQAWCKVRSLFDEWGKPLQKVEPGCAAQVTGWRALPAAGDLALEVESEQRAHEVMKVREQASKVERLAVDAKVIEEKMAESRKSYREELEARRALGYYRKRRTTIRAKETEEDNHPALHVVVKGDTDGSVEALLDILETYDRHDDCRLDVVHYGVGPVSLSDLELAKTFDGIVYAMHVGILPETKAVAKEDEIKSFKVIYKLVEDIKAEIGNRLPMINAEEVIGEAKVLQEFLINDKRKKLPVAGCRCLKGDLLKAETFKLMRNGEEIHRGPVISMKHMKNEVKSIKTGVECGIMFADSDVRFKENDEIVCIREYKVNQKTSWSPRGF
ncbi:translation initiation factor IF-2, mitochondrial [Galendromus occidentalis]|uniref:Translation initiation factor IF-2, mitochondrial n=1 Tax=Galendromus occidentalis TaxID=34638 RepID=A0AAJ7SIA6_9ACAR|nr:translation initiation factor IF-2, mitochondrial [Galendromus occidentalis]